MGDMPFVSIDILQKIREEFRLHPQNIVAPMFGKKRGQPVLFSSQFFADLAQCSGDIGGRNIIKTNKERLHLVEVKRKTIFWDVDTKEDMKRYQEEPRNE